MLLFLSSQQQVCSSPTITFFPLTSPPNPSQFSLIAPNFLLKKPSICPTCNTPPPSSSPSPPPSPPSTSVYSQPTTAARAPTPPASTSTPQPAVRTTAGPATPASTSSPFPEAGISKSEAGLEEAAALLRYQVMLKASRDTVSVTRTPFPTSLSRAAGTSSSARGGAGPLNHLSSVPLRRRVRVRVL